MKKGFTLIELMVVMGIIGLLVAIATTNLVGLQQNTYLQSSVSVLIEDIKQQQLKAMSGDTEGRGVNAPYGIYFDTSGYVLFHGSTYSPSEPTNLLIELENNVRISNTTFPQSAIVFQKGSGELLNFVDGSNSITLRNVDSNEQKTVQINKYGAIVNVN